MRTVVAHKVSFQMFTFHPPYTMLLFYAKKTDMREKTHLLEYLESSCTYKDTVLGYLALVMQDTCFG